MENRKKKQKIEKVTKPYMKGDLFDKTVFMGALKMFVSTLAMTLVFVIAGLIVSWDNQLITILLNGSIVLVAYMIFWQTGMNSGADAVNQGEIMLQRSQKGRPVADWERSMCFHPGKGFMKGLIGSIPLVVVSLILAITAERQMTGLGALPSWVNPLEARAEIGNALAFYHADADLSLTALCRVFVRMSVMPYVNMVGAVNKDAMLVLERVSPLLNLLPGLAYGIGYLGGVSVRTEVHTNIALGKKKLAKKQRKERKARKTMVHKGPEQLN